MIKANNMNYNSPVVVGLDIGTTKVVAIAGIRNQKGRIDIVGFGMSESKGVDHGLVLNIDQCVGSIMTAIENCRKSNPNLEINNVYVGIAGKHVKSIQNRGERIRSDIESLITRAEIDLLIQDQYKTYLPPGEKIIDVVPQDFTVDDKRYILNPVGMRGTKIGANFHIITGGKSDIQSINMCVNNAHLNTADIVLQPMASAAAVMSEEELEMGVAIVDIGGGTTDMAVFKEGVLHHTQVIPFAGENITLDIKNNLGILKTQAEQLKVKFGEAIENSENKNKYVTIPGIKGHLPKEIAVNSLANIINAKVEEIMSRVLHELEMIGLKNQLHGGMILTGGGAHLKNIKALAEFVTTMNVRIGYPDEHINFTKEVALLRNPKFSTCIGLVLKGFSDIDNGKKAFHTNLEENRIFQVSNNEDMEVEELIEDDFREFEDIPETNQSEEIPQELAPKKEVPQTVNVQNRQLFMGKIFNSFKKGLLELFEGEGDIEFPEDSKFQ